jgi:mono/diheme cytochrome c family protein
VRVASLGSACVLVAAIAAGCGSTGSGSGGSNGAGHGGMGAMMGREATTPGPSTTATRRGGTAPATGRAIFLASGCGGCHALSAAGTTGTAGPDLDRSRPSYARVLARVTDGGGGMPSFAGSLTSAQIRALARYVSDAARQ